MTSSNLLIHYLKSLSIFLIAAALIYYLLNDFLDAAGYMLHKQWGLYVFFAVMALSFHAGLIYMGSEDNRAFVKYFMAASVIKILICVLVFVLFAVARPYQAKAFGIRFLVLYLLFMIFEVFYLQKNASKLRADK